VSAPSRRRGPRRAWAAVDGARARQRRLEAWVERRYPALYDGRHAAAGVGRLLWPLIGPILMALVVLPVVAVLAGLVYALLALLGALGVEPPHVDLPTIPWPDVTAPGWVRWLGEALSDVLEVLGPVARVVVVGGAVVYGIHRTWAARRTRREAEALGRAELMRRLGVGLSAIYAARMTTRWTVTARGRLRTVIELHGDDDELLSTLELTGRRSERRLGKATDSDGREWHVEVGLDTVLVALGDRTYATLVDGALTVGGKTLRCTVSNTGTRTAKVVDSAGRTLLTAAPGEKDRPWVVFDVDRGELPQPRAVVLGIAFLLLHADAMRFSGGTGSGLTQGGGA
jgi:hypothetical protein